MTHEPFVHALFAATCFLACEKTEPASRPPTSTTATAVASATAIATATTSTQLAVTLVSAGRCEGMAPPAGDKASLTAARRGDDVEVTVKNVGGYCKTDATYTARLDGDTVHLTRAKPTAVSRCVCMHDLVVVVRGVPAGASTIVYEEEPYASDAGVAVIASGSLR